MQRDSNILIEIFQISLFRRRNQLFVSLHFLILHKIIIDTNTFEISLFSHRFVSFSKEKISRRKTRVQLVDESSFIAGHERRCLRSKDIARSKEKSGSQNGSGNERVNRWNRIHQCQPVRMMTIFRNNNVDFEILPITK